MQKLMTLIATLATSLLIADVLPESMRVYPTPQDVKLGAEAMIAKPKTVAIQNINQLDADAVRVLKSFLKVQDDATFTITWRADDTLPAEGYLLSLTEAGVEIAAKDGAGFFYAAKTLKQLMASGNFRAVQIKDWPAIPFRGTVEGFYGQPWSFEARKSQFRFYGDWKMNTYIYGPKDDPFHGFSTRWRDPYPETEARRIAELVKVAHENKVNFVWAVHPGRDIQWKDDSDIKACVAKFEMMYQLGVRSFAVFFDDIGGEGARAEKQVELLNYVNRHFVRQKPDVTPLIICPTQYNKAWSNGTYLETLGQGLDEDIMVMWTGDSVCTDITLDSMKWINNKLGRKAYIWWNWPVADYCRGAQLLLGRTYGLDPENATLYSGFVSNPMDKPEASKIPLFGVADYCWNPTGFNSQQSWEDCFPRLFPHVAKAVRKFAEHNSDQGPNGHGYRREESVAIAPTVKVVMDALKRGEPIPRKELDCIIEEFRAIQSSARTILTECHNPLFLEDVTNWCQVFEAFGETGETLSKALIGEVPEKEALRAVLMARAYCTEISKAHAAKPFQKNPTKVANRVLLPYQELAAATIYQHIWRNVAGKDAPVGGNASKMYEFITNIDALKNLQVARDGAYIRLPKVFEPKTIQPGEWFGIRLPEGVPAVWAHFMLDNPAACKQGRLQVSTDGGKSWGDRSMVILPNGQEGSMEIRHIKAKEGVNAVRYINASTQPVTVTLNMVKVDVPAGAEANVYGAMTDGDWHSCYTIEPGAKLRIPLAAPVTQDNTRVLATGGSFTVSYEEDAVIITADPIHPVNVYEVIH